MSLLLTRAQRRGLGCQLDCSEQHSDSGAPPLLELEHETRACRHFQFMKQVEYRGV